TSASGALERGPAGLRAELVDPAVVLRREGATGVRAARRLAVPTLLVDVELVVALGVVAHGPDCTAHRRTMHRSPRHHESTSRIGGFIAFAARVGSKYSRRNAIFPAEARRKTTYSCR